VGSWGQFLNPVAQMRDTGTLDHRDGTVELQIAVRPSTSLGCTGV
jgi:gamma-glutamyl:cysteine ligase YbdK (ATP-grasp superfamily)